MFLLFIWNVPEVCVINNLNLFSLYFFLLFYYKIVYRVLWLKSWEKINEKNLYSQKLDNFAIFINLIHLLKKNNLFAFFSFTLYPAHSRERRGNLVLRHFVPHFPPNSGDINCLVTQFYAALCHDTRGKKWKYKKFLWVEIDPTHKHVKNIIKNIYLM